MDVGGAITRIIDGIAEIDAVKAGQISLGCGAALLIFGAGSALVGQWTKNSSRLLSKLKGGKAPAFNPHASMRAYPTDPQALVTWSNGNEPTLTGDVERLCDVAATENILEYGAWLNPARANLIKAAVTALQADGTPFQLILQANNGQHIEVEGRTFSGEAVMRLRDVSKQRQELLKLANDHENLKIETIGLRAMLDTISQPIWLRDRNGRISWVNEPYAFAVDAENGADVVAQQIEFLDELSRKQAADALLRGDVFHARVPTIIVGQRRIFDVVETPLAAGSIGYAADVSDLESIRNDLQKQMASHVRTLDQLPTAVAIFDERQCLVFCNLAYRTLWQLDESFTNSQPTDSEILDRLRDARRLPEQADYKSWKKALHEAYHTLETQEIAWYLPGGRTLRVVLNPNPKGGVTYLFEDVTAQFILQSNYNALSRVQSETLDSLKEGVAVFGTDGRLKLNNPAFENIWGLNPDMLSRQPHIDQIILESFKLYDDSDVWAAIKGAIAGISDARHGQSFRMERYNGSIIDCALAPLPDGATLVTFVDVSATVHFERALKERNEALEHAGQLRENFVHHVSYQLRSPLTNVIGFTELLASGAAGSLTERQSEYVGHVFQSSKSLMAIIDDILDLASFDRGEMDLEPALVDIRGVVAAAKDGLQDQIRKRQISIDVMIDENVGTFWLDEKRLRQILFNLLSNAIGFSSDDQTISISVAERDEELVLSVRDKGRGIPAEIIDRVFNRFETYTIGSRHRGAGLGLSIVRALVELHGGYVTIDSMPGEGTCVSCIFPAMNKSNEEVEAA